MRINIDPKLFRKLLIGVIVIVLLFFILRHFRAKSAYAIPTNTASFVGSITGTTLTVPVNGVISGRIVVGAIVTGTGISSGTTITAFISGTAGGAGTYTVSVSQSVAAGTTMTTAVGASFTGTIAGTTLTVNSAGLLGTIAVGATVAGTTISPGTTITAFISGTAGGAGTYTVSVSQSIGTTASPVAMTATVIDTGLASYQTNTSKCRAVYLNALNQANGVVADVPSATTTALATCYSSEAGTYVGSKCTYTTISNIPTATGTLVDTLDVKNMYEAMGLDIVKIQEAYQPILDLLNTLANRTYTYTVALSLSGLPTITNGTTVTVDDLIAARRADISNPTRKFYAQVCPGFFAPAAGGTDPGPTYKTWTYASNIRATRMVAVLDTATNSLKVSTVGADNVGINNIAIWKIMKASAAGTNSDKAAKAGPLTIPQPTWN